MAEEFNVDLPPRFKYTRTTIDAKEKELEEYVRKFSVSTDEMFRRLFHRLVEPLTQTIYTLTNDATPSVANGNVFLTGGTTTITDFDDGIEGQTITIIAEHGITITDATNIFLSGSTNFVMAATDTLTLLCKADNKWYEIGRSDNT